jgi:8-oxo-dGTP pyrophosphatase MutT (NUDIX family)
MEITPTDAATVVLLRDLPDSSGFEVLMVLRNPDSAFVPSAYVFPGGCLEDSDFSPDIDPFCTGVDRAVALRRMDAMSQPEKAIGAWVGGIRETFEEVGLLFAYREDGSLLAFDSGEMAERFHTHRRLLFEGKRPLQTILADERLTLAADRLHYFSHWITPELLPLRYDVRFFVARAPSGQEALHDGIELTRHVWITPQDALALFKKCRCNMVLPTLMTMCELARFNSVEDVILSTKEKNVSGVLTKMIEEDDDIVEYMPDGRAFKGMPRSV